MVCARLDAEGSAQQIVRGHALQHHRRGLLVGDGIRDRHQPVGRDQTALGVGAERPGVGDPLADPNLAHALADRFDHAGALLTRDEGQTRRRIQAAPEIDVDEVESDRCLPDQGLAGPGRPDLNLLELQNLGPARLVHPYDTGHRRLSPTQPNRGRQATSRNVDRQAQTDFQARIVVRGGSQRAAAPGASRSCRMLAGARAAASSSGSVIGRRQVCPGQT